jgi:hypothetical protein
MEEVMTEHTPGLRFRVEERTPAHTTFRVFVGAEGQGGNAGLLTFRNEDYDKLAPLLLAAPALLEALECEVLFRQEEVMEILLGSGERAGRLDAGRARNCAERSRAAIAAAKP